MLEREERTALIVYLYYNRDAKKLAQLGDVLYQSKKHRYVQLYVFSCELEEVMERLSTEKYVKKIQPCLLKDLGTDFVGTLGNMG